MAVVERKTRCSSYTTRKTLCYLRQRRRWMSSRTFYDIIRVFGHMRDAVHVL